MHEGIVNVTLPLLMKSLSLAHWPVVASYPSSYILNQESPVTLDWVAEGTEALEFISSEAGGEIDSLKRTDRRGLVL